ncbi:11458_t:CDS:2 [Acaulospora colombiana]|uniref:11458_t:CDS:1 n=1 Tax=Acaulospora colombiana TaxID=27376 RepID=A0ACA9K2A0_9GLOM|nr:11458_t:CDS:2 [Acaulospora colombiana]
MSKIIARYQSLKRFGIYDKPESKVSGKQKKIKDSTLCKHFKI